MPMNEIICNLIPTLILISIFIIIIIVYFYLLFLFSNLFFIYLF